MRLEITWIPLSDQHRELRTEMGKSMVHLWCSTWKASSADPGINTKGILSSACSPWKLCTNKFVLTSSLRPPMTRLCKMTTSVRATRRYVLLFFSFLPGFLSYVLLFSLPCANVCSGAYNSYIFKAIQHALHTVHPSQDSLLFLRSFEDVFFHIRQLLQRYILLLTKS